MSVVLIEEGGLPICPVSARKIKERVESTKEKEFGVAIWCPLCLNYTVFEDSEEYFQRNTRHICSCGKELGKVTTKHEIVRIGSVFVWDEVGA